MAVDLTKLIDIDLMAYFKAKLDLIFAGKVDKENGKSLSSNDYTSAEKTKLSGIATGAQVNVLEGVQINGATVSPTNKIVNISVPVKTSDITNDSGFITGADIPEGAAASTLAPLMDGIAATGSSNAFARGDHVHPSDTTKVDKVAGKGLSTEDYTSTEKTKLSGIATGAQVNVIENIKVNGATQTITSKEVNITIPTKASDLNLDNVYTKTEIDQKLTGAMNYKGTVSAISNLPASNNSTGDVYHVTADGSEWAWNGSAWEEMGTAIDLSGYVETSDLGLATNAEIDALFE